MQFVVENAKKLQDQLNPRGVQIDPFCGEANPSPIRLLNFAEFDGQCRHRSKERA
jgi:hypothetical protein